MITPTPLGTSGKLPSLRYRVVVNILDVVVLPTDEAPPHPGGPDGAPASSGQGAFDGAAGGGSGGAPPGAGSHAGGSSALGRPAVPSRAARQAVSTWPPSGPRCLPRPRLHARLPSRRGGFRVSMLLRSCLFGGRPSGLSWRLRRSSPLPRVAFRQWGRIRLAHGAGHTMGRLQDLLRQSGEGLWCGRPRRGSDASRGLRRRSWQRSRERD
jgi:hypothetical protein